MINNSSLLYLLSTDSGSGSGSGIGIAIYCFHTLD